MAGSASALSGEPRRPGGSASAALDDLERRIVVATQAGLPLVPKPYQEVAGLLGVSPEVVMEKIRNMLACGIIRRIGVVPNHYALGYCANGMSVWNVPDGEISRLGHLVGQFSFVSHCYHRPRHLPQWPYNMFAMVHGRDRAEVEGKVAEIARALGEHDGGHTTLYSTRILKKTGIRITAAGS